MYFNALSEVFDKISKCENKQLNVLDILEGPICHGGFSRLN